MYLSYFLIVKYKERFIAVKTVSKKSNKRIKSIWLINMLVCVLFIAGNSKSIFANNYL